MDDGGGNPSGSDATAGRDVTGKKQMTTNGEQIRGGEPDKHLATENQNRKQPCKKRMSTTIAPFGGGQPSHFRVGPGARGSWLVGNPVTESPEPAQPAEKGLIPHISRLPG